MYIQTLCRTTSLLAGLLVLQQAVLCTPYSTPTGTATALVVSAPNTTVNILAYGADPSGVNDSAAAVRAVAAALGSTPATLYFPTGTYRFASHGATAEECVRLASSISLLGDGPGLTIFTDDVTPAAMAQFGFFWSMGTAGRDDYSFEIDPGYPVNASGASYQSATLTMTLPSNTALYTVGQYVYLRGNSLPQPGEYHGELNLIASVNPLLGTVTLAWPLSSDFTQDTGLQLNLVAQNEVVTNIQISGITFNFHNNALLAAQVLGLKISNNTFNYEGATPGWEVSQFNQLRHVEFNNNTVNNPLGAALDVEHTSASWDIHDNIFSGYFNAGEGSANFSFHNNTITCTNQQICVRFGGTTGNTVTGNQISATCPSDSCHAVTDVSGTVTSPKTIISNNTILSQGPRAISAYTPGTLITGNNITSLDTGIDMGGGVTARNNTVTLTGDLPYGCVLVEGTTHNAVIEGLTCNGNSTLYDRAVWIADDGPQAGTQVIIDGVVGNTLNIGIFVMNGQNDSPLIGTVSFSNTLTPFSGRNTWMQFGGNH